MTMLTSYGRREWLGAALLLSPVAALSLLIGWWPVAALLILIWIAIAMFFRDPPRVTPRDLPDGAMLSPADGRITAIEDVFEHPATSGGATVIRIFLSVFNVHVNRAPCDATIVESTHTPGEHIDARVERSAFVNENTLTIFTAANTDHRFGVRQISGAVARRIVCRVRPGETVRRGQRFGMIKFGSSTELIIPKTARADVRVRPGDRVRAGVTILAVIHPNGATTRP